MGLFQKRFSLARLRQRFSCRENVGALMRLKRVLGFHRRTRDVRGLHFFKGIWHHAIPPATEVTHEGKNPIALLPKPGCALPRSA
jgi:hypothetical protein